MRRNYISQFSYGAFAIFSAFALLIALFAGIPTVRAASNSSSDEHLITIHDRGQEKSLISSEDTLREVFVEAGIIMDENDIVEPGLDETLVASSYQVNVYRARPITIVDGMRQVAVMSAYQTPKQIVEHAGMTLHDQDTTEMKLNTNFIKDGSPLKLVIARAAAVKLVLYGKKETVYTQKETVADFLKEKSIALGKKDTLSVKLDKKIKNNMRIEVWRNGVQTVTKEVDIPPETKIIQDSNREVGYKKVAEPGEVGKKSVTYEITMRNGKEVARKEIQSVVIKKAKQKVVTVGAKQKVFGGNCSSWIAGAGIRDTANATYLIGAESGCNPYAVNASSGACGVGQALPCGKTGCEMGDGACQTKWMNGYVMGRYGSWQAAADHHRTRGWY
jgi:uncharacterized protein YabE (DUF348 family)